MISKRVGCQVMMSKRVGCQVMMSKCEGRLSGYDDVQV